LVYGWYKYQTNKSTIMKTKIFIAMMAMALFAACKGRNGYEVVNNSKSADTAGVSSASDTAADAKPKLVKTADMSFKVKNVQQTGDSIAILTNRYSGMIMHHQMASEIEKSENIRVSNDSIRQVNVYKTAANMTVKVPSAKLEDFMNHVGCMAVLTISRKMDVEDKTFDYTSTKLKVKNRKEWVAQNNKQDKESAKDPDVVLALKDNMVDDQVNNLKTNAGVKYSIIVLSFYQDKTISKQLVANDDPSAYHPPFLSRLFMALANGWYIFSEIILGLANMWMFVLIGSALWIGYKMHKRKYPALKA
jgi:carbonic anhydrase